MLDYIIKNCTIIDGTGSKAYQGIVGIKKDRIIIDPQLHNASAKTIINAEGKVISPGFIDIHSHHDLYIVDQDPIQRFASFAQQGVTTAVVGNCGWAMAPIPFLPLISNILPYFFNIIEAINTVIPLPGVPNPALDKGMEIINRAIDRGIDVGMDAVPYTMGNTTITALFPPWVNRGGRRKLLERLKNPDIRQKIKKQIETTVPKWPHWEEESWSDPHIRAIGWKPVRVLSVKSPKNRWVEGKTFIEIAKVWKTDPFDALCRLTLEEEGEVTYTYGYPARPWLEKMFNTMLTHPMMSIGADSILPATKEGTPPPSAYGCFPRFIGHYSRELQLLPLEEAIRRITSLAARRYKLENRGIIKNSAFADIVIFDPKTINEQFTEDGKPATPTGIEHVFINGQHMVKDGKLQHKVFPGKVLKA